jgi:hypothetical protein
VDPRVGLDAVAKKKISSLTLPEIEPRSSSLVATLAELPWLLQNYTQSETHFIGTVRGGCFATRSLSCVLPFSSKESLCLSLSALGQGTVLMFESS